MTLPDLTSLEWRARSRHQASGLNAVHEAKPAKIENLTAVVSGKGGVGKTNLVANLAVARAGQGARVLVLDGDAGLANLDVVMGMAPERTLADVLRERCGFRDALVAGPKGVQLLPSGTGRRDLALFEHGGVERLRSLLVAESPGFDHVLLDAGAGIGDVVIDFAGLARTVWLVATPEPASFADAYATFKTIAARDPSARVELVVNCAATEKEGREVHRHLERMCARFLSRELPLRCVLLRDARLLDAVARQQLLVEAYPTSPLARRIARWAHEWPHSAA